MVVVCVDSNYRIQQYVKMLFFGEISDDYGVGNASGAQ